MPVGAGGALPGWLTAAAGRRSARTCWPARWPTPATAASPAAITNLPVPGRRPRSVVAVGIGDATLPDLRAYVAVAVRRGADSWPSTAPAGWCCRWTPAAAPAGADEVRAAVETALLAGYRFRETSAPAPAPAGRGDRRGRRRRRPGRGRRRRAPARLDRRVGRLGPRPGQHPEQHQEPGVAGRRRPRERLAGLADVTVTVLGPDELRGRRLRRRARRRRRLGLARRGWSSPATGPPAPRPGHPVLVGKGITFDTGGLSIKTNAGMREMKTDMAGGAAVLAAVDAAARLRLPVAVTAVVAGARRTPSPARPTGRPTSSGTSAGAPPRCSTPTPRAGWCSPTRWRYARLALGATVLVDVATLTGAMKVGAGRADRRAATRPPTGWPTRCSPPPGTPGSRCGGCRWPRSTRRPARQLDPGRRRQQRARATPAATTAALFLQPFAGDLPWAHLDIAGPARAGSRRRRAGQGRHRVRRPHAAALAGGRRAGGGSPTIVD